MQKLINRGHVNVQKGFTLIELLVVIAIIGILAGIVLASLGSARNKGGDAAVQGDLVGIRSQAELFATNNSNSYSGMCTDSTVASALSAAMTAGGATAINTTAATAGADATVTCHATSSVGWVVEAPLKTGGFWCVDSTGTSTRTSASTVGANDGGCN